MKRFLHKYIVAKTWFRRLEKALHNFHFGREVKISAYVFIKILLKNILNNSLHIRASSVAFSLTLSLFPFLLFLITLIPYTPIDYEQVMAFAKSNLPADIFKFVDGTIHDIMSNRRTDLLSISFLFAIYAATNGMAALIVAFNSVFLYAEKRSFFKLRLIALYLTLLIAFVFLFAVLALIVSRFVISALADWGFLNNDLLVLGILAAKYIIAFSVFFIAISVIYYIAPASHERWSFFSLGSVFTSISAILVTNLFSFYLENFASYNKLYGSIGTFIALMLWIYLLSFLLLVGFELNASLMEARKVYDGNNETKSIE
ncbi:MAG: YihY/virulence factor BrkB family protein [Raineya sp.]